MLYNRLCWLKIICVGANAQEFKNGCQLNPLHPISYPPGHSRDRLYRYKRLVNRRSRPALLRRESINYMCAARFYSATTPLLMSLSAHAAGDWSMNSYNRRTSVTQWDPLLIVTRGLSRLQSVIGRLQRWRLKTIRSCSTQKGKPR